MGAHTRNTFRKFLCLFLASLLVVSSSRVQADQTQSNHVHGQNGHVSENEEIRTQDATISNIYTDSNEVELLDEIGIEKELNDEILVEAIAHLKEKSFLFRGSPEDMLHEYPIVSLDVEEGDIYSRRYKDDKQVLLNNKKMAEINEISEKEDLAENNSIEFHETNMFQDGAENTLSNQEEHLYLVAEDEGIFTDREHKDTKFDEIFNINFEVSSPSKEEDDIQEKKVSSKEGVSMLKEDSFPNFPSSFSSQVDFEEKRYYSWDFFIDSDLRMYRIDSFGVPAAFRTQDDHPLFMFIYNYNENLLYSFLPNPHGDSYFCRITKTPVFKAFPSLENSGVLKMMTYIGEIDTPKASKADYWSLDIGGFFAIDLMLNKEDGLPFKLSVSTDNIYFSNFNAEKPDPKHWEFPTHEKCDSSALTEEELQYIPEILRKRLLRM